MVAINQTKATAAAVAVALAAAAPFAVPMIQKWESGGRTHLEPYRDPIGIWTVCDGETRVPMRRYSAAECQAMTERAFAEFGREVLACTPGIAGRPRMVAAAVSFAYNVGSAAYCRSSVARAFRAERWAEGCDALLAWKFAGGRALPGLTNRRRDERRLCLDGAK
jgi:lysozyme